MTATRTSTYPTTLDAAPQAPTQNDTLATPEVEHDNLHSWAMDAIRKIEIELGINGSADPTSVNYQMAHHTHLGTDGSAKFATVSLSNTTATGKAIISNVASGAFNRFEMTADGGMSWGPGSAAVDTTLSRSQAKRLQLLGGFTAFNQDATQVTLVAKAATGSISSTTLAALRDENDNNITTFRYDGLVSTTGRINVGSLTAIPGTPIISVDNTVGSGNVVIGGQGFLGQTADLLQLQDSTGTKLAGISAAGLLDLSAVAATSTAAGAATGDKISLFASMYGLGVQSGAMVAYVPSSGAFQLRNPAASGQISSGTEVIRLTGAGSVQATSPQSYFGDAALGGTGSELKIGSYVSATSAGIAALSSGGNTDLFLRSQGTGLIYFQTGGGATIGSIDSTGAFTATKSLNISGAGPYSTYGDIVFANTGASTAGQGVSLTSLSTGSPRMYFDHRASGNTGDWMWRNGSPTFATTRMTLDGGGNLSTYGYILGAGLRTGGDPGAGTVSQITFTSSSGVGNGAATGLTAPAKGTGGGPASLQAFNWMKIYFGTTTAYVPVFS